MNTDSRPEGRTLPLSHARRVNSACDRFEAVWRAGQRPRIEDALAGFTEPGRAKLLLELLRLELAYRCRGGEQPTREEYQQRFPGDGDIIDEAFRSFESLPTTVPFPAGTIAPPFVDPVSAVDDSQPGWPQIPGYELLGELGRGAMGVVYKARQLGLDRLVALKMIVLRARANAEFLNRFRIEGEAIARLQHPNIVQIHEVGEHEGSPYFCLEWCAGGSLASQLQGKLPLRPDEAAGHMETLARAVHAAHQRDVIHRDLKPSNVLVTDDGTLKISDFGLAKKLDDDSGNTRTGEPMGTAQYMSPEQAAGKANQVGPAADVYSLGTMLYEMLTGHPPFKGSNENETMAMVCTLDPVAPRTHRPAVPLDLDTICLACLEKDPGHRYATAKELADELRRFLDGRPIVRRPLRWWGRAAKYARRHPARALLLVFFGVIVMLSAATLVTSTRLDLALKELDDATVKASHARAERSALENDVQHLEELKADRDVSVSHIYLEEESYQKALTFLPDKDRSRLGFPYRHLLARLAPEVRTLAGVARPSFVTAISPDARIVAFATSTGLYVRDTAVETDTFRDLHYDPLEYPVAIAFSRGDPKGDGRKVVVAGYQGSVHLGDWKQNRLTALPVADLAREPKLTDLVKSKRGPVRIALTPDGHTLAATGPASGWVALLYDDRHNKNWLPLLGHRNAITALAFSPDGSLLATGAGPDEGVPGAIADPRGVVRLWNVAKGVPVELLPVDGGAVQNLWFSPDGKKLAIAGTNQLAIAGTNQSVQFYSINPNGAVPGRSFKPRHGAVRTLAFTHDGLTAVIADNETLRIWNLISGEERAVPHGHGGGVGCLAFLDDGKTFHSVGADGRIKLWDLAATEHPKRLQVGTPELDAQVGVWCVAFSPDSRFVVTAAGNEVIVYDLVARKEHRLPDHTGAVCAAVFSPDGKLLATGGIDKTVRLWSLGDLPARPRILPGREGTVTGLAFTPDSGTLASSGKDVGILVWNLGDLDKQPLCLSTDQPAAALAFSPDGKRLLAGTYITRNEEGTRGEIKRWEIAGGKGLGELYGHQWAVRALAFAPNAGRPTLASGGEDGTVLVWDSEGGKPRPLKTSGPAPVFGVAFSPDGRTLATAGAQLTLWDAASGDERFAFRSAGLPFRAAAFSPDGRWLAGRAADGNLTLWRAGVTPAGGR